ncbi:MAG: enoyl-CoA hydratase/isomerase family protein, partial [Deltaproteobacteria bacterium]|nr:enoyl-CoA hydratase/isomerase family protein [Deltaproteobacteria bacterium]
GIALGGGMELAIRCHGIVAIKTTRFQFPVISLGLLPAIGGGGVRYRKWPQGADIFNDMIILGKPLKASQAADIGMIDILVDDYDAMIKAALALVTDLEGRLPRIADDPVTIQEPVMPDAATLAKHMLSAEAVAVTIKTIKTCAAAGSFADALESCNQGFGKICCTDAAREGISAFLEKRKPVFKK